MSRITLPRSVLAALREGIDEHWQTCPEGAAVVAQLDIALSAPQQAEPDLLAELRAASNYIDTLGGDSKAYRAAIAAQQGYVPVAPAKGAHDGSRVVGVGGEGGGILGGRLDRRQVCRARLSPCS